MLTAARLTRVFKSSPEISFDDRSRLVFFSDCHRGDASWADNFADNESVYTHVLEEYLRRGFTYFELGDGDDLWKTGNFADIRNAHAHVFDLLRKYHSERRLHLLWGNHDHERSNPVYVKRTLQFLSDTRQLASVKERRRHALSPEGVRVREGIVLRHARTGQTIFLVHGHQGSILGDWLWWLGMVLVRYVITPLQVFGVKDPTSPAASPRRAGNVGGKLAHWAAGRKQMLIAGHTHRWAYPKPEEPAYFNPGCCVSPRAITAIEIAGGKIALHRWREGSDARGYMKVVRDTIAGPVRLANYLTMDIPRRRVSSPA